MHEPLRVTSQLSESWAFLSGEQRVFDEVPPSPTAHYAPFTYLMPLRHAAAEGMAAVGVLLQAADVQTAAAYMLGLPPQQLAAEDLCDSGAEVCNVMSGCLIAATAGIEHVTFGLPRHLDEKNFHCCTQNSVLSKQYLSQLDGKTLAVLVFDPFFLGD